MSSVIGPAAWVLFWALQILSWVIIVNAILSWLVAFDVINLRNRAAYSFYRLLDAITTPVLAPFRRFIPNLGGMDITPLVALILIGFIMNRLAPYAMFSPFGF